MIWLAGLLVALAGASAAQAVGTAVGVDPDAEARGKTTRTLVVGADVFIGDRIVTDARGEVQILFDDKSRLVVGPRSSLVIEDYLQRNNGSAGKFAVNALNGAFRFITGGAPKDRYVITTPTGQIGVRGTAFDFYVTRTATYLLQLHGATVNCARAGECGVLSSVCEVGVMRRGEVETHDHVRDLGRGERDQVRGWFPYAASQTSLLRPFRVNGAERCLRSPVVPDEPAESLSRGPLPRGGDKPGLH
jgi:hypothetical protein